MIRAVGVVMLVGASGCLFGTTAATDAAMRDEARASVARRAAIERKDYAAAIAYDDVFLARNGKGDTALRDARKHHFSDWVDHAIAELGPPSKTNLDALFGTLVAFRRESRRAATPLWLREIDDSMKIPAERRTEDPSVALRRADLGTVDATLIAPRLAELATPMWTSVDDRAHAGELVAAIARGRAIVRELAPDDPHVAALAALETRGAATFLARARATDDALPGARVLHAKLAALLGGAPGTLAYPPALVAETGGAWDLVAPDAACGDLLDSGKPVAIADALRGGGWAAPATPTAGTPSLAIHLATTCPVDVKREDTTEEIAYVTERVVKSREPIYDRQCMPNVYKEDRERTEDYLVTTKWVVPAECHDEVVGSREVEHTVREPGSEVVTVHHTHHVFALAGKFSILVDDTTRGWDFDLVGTSADEVEYHGTHVNHSPGGGGEQEARRDAHAKLAALMRARRNEIYAAKATAMLARARDAAAATKALEADHAFFVAYALAGDGVVPPAMAEWIAATYQVPPAALAAALAGTPLAPADLADGHDVKAIDLPLHLHDYAQLDDETGTRAIERQISLSFTGGPALTKTAAASSTGGLVSLQVNVNPAEELFAFRVAGGGLGTGGGHGFVDANFDGGYGLSTRALWLGPLLGLGGDFMTGVQEQQPTAAQFVVRPGLYVEYGARFAYTFPKNGKLELQYGKQYRSTTSLASEKRGEARFYYSGLGTPLVVSFRYTEYLPDLDGFFTPFTATGRIARSTWIFGGFGF